MGPIRRSAPKEAGLAASRLDPDAPTPLYRQIAAALRHDVLAGHLRPGARLQATRVLARELGVSRNTVQLTFDELLAEGYLEARVGAGTFVAAALPEELLTAPAPPEIGPTPAAAPPRLAERGRRVLELPPREAVAPRPFQGGLPAVDAFPHALWSRLLQRRLRHPAPADWGYGDPAGHRPLREALARTLRSSRGLDCNPDEVLVVHGSQQGLDLAARVLLDPGDRAWIEDPGYSGTRAALTAAGAELVPVPDDGEGLRVDAGVERAPDARLACVTPSYQYPLGAVLSAARRLQLLEWARRADAWIVEDDYDSEYRYQGRPLHALKSLDRDRRVIYVGTCSKVLAPALRLGYLVAPPALVGAFKAMRSAVDRQSAVVEQAALAELIDGGHFARHVRRMRTLYAERQRALVEAAAGIDGLRVEPSPAGMHLVGWLEEGIDDRAVQRSAAARGVSAAALSAFCAEASLPPALVLGYAAFSPADIRAALRRLADVLAGI